MEEALAEYRILDVRMPTTVDLDQDVDWICRCFGFLEMRDKEKTAAKIFRALLEAATKGSGLSSDDLAKKTGLTRGTIVHHLNKLIKSGLVIHHEGQYKLRDMSLLKTIEEIERDLARIFENIKQVASSIDKSMGFLHR